MPVDGILKQYSRWKRAFAQSCVQRDRHDCPEPLCPKCSSPAHQTETDKEIVRPRVVTVCCWAWWQAHLVIKISFIITVQRPRLFVMHCVEEKE
jgi:hypothetical protein